MTLGLIVIGSQIPTHHITAKNTLPNYSLDLTKSKVIIGRCNEPMYIESSAKMLVFFIFSFGFAIVGNNTYSDYGYIFTIN